MVLFICLTYVLIRMSVVLSIPHMFLAKQKYKFNISKEKKRGEKRKNVMMLLSGEGEKAKYLPRKSVKWFCNFRKKKKTNFSL